MSLAQIQIQTTQIKWKRARAILAFCGALVFSLALTPPAKAAFTGDYALSRFMLGNMNADGIAITPDGGLSIVVTGGNNGSGQPGTTDLTTTATGSGTVQFHYSYITLDSPGADFAGYLLDGVFSQFADTDGQSGNGMFAVTAGGTFGFRVGTTDNTGEPGVLTISNFSAPTGPGGSVPEPGTASMLLLAAGVALAGYRRIHRIHRVKAGGA